MRKLLLLLCLVLSSTLFTYATPVTTSKENTNSRYEVIESKDLKDYKFNLDKYTGIVYQYGQKDRFTHIWEEKFIQCQDDVEDSTKVNYVLELGVQKPDDCYLININNGRTWKLEYEHVLHIYFFKLMKEEN